MNPLVRSMILCPRGELNPEMLHTRAMRVSIRSTIQHCVAVCQDSSRSRRQGVLTDSPSDAVDAPGTIVAARALAEQAPGGSRSIDVACSGRSGSEETVGDPGRLADVSATPSDRQRGRADPVVDIGLGPASVITRFVPDRPGGWRLGRSESYAIWRSMGYRDTTLEAAVATSERVEAATRLTLCCSVALRHAVQLLSHDQGIRGDGQHWECAGLGKDSEPR
jgi:hypothetical protein